VILRDARIVDQIGMTVREFRPDQFEAAHQVAALIPKDGGLEMRTVPGADDPYLVVAPNIAFNLSAGLSLWPRLKAAIPVFLGVLAGTLLVIFLWQPLKRLASHRLVRTEWLWLIAVALVLFQLWLVSAQTIYAIGGAEVDDALFVNLTKHLLRGDWLGPYNQYTLAKGPMYSLFMAGVFLSGVPLFIAQQLLYVVACGLLCRALRPLVRSEIVRLGLFAVLLFNPITYCGTVTLRVQRQNIVPALVLLIIAGLVALYARRDAAKRKLVPWSVLTGIALGAFWLTREEAVWLIPTVGLMWGTAILAVWLDRAPDRKARIAVFLIPGILWTASVGTIASINWRYYGVFTTCEFRQSDFKAAIGSLLRIHPRQFRPFLPITRELRERAYAVSPTFAELRPYFEGSLGESWAKVSFEASHIPPSEREIPVGWHIWAIREAVIASGHGKTGAEAMAFYAQMAREINDACDRGLIEAGPHRTGFLSPLPADVVAPLLDGCRHAVLYIANFDETTVETPMSAGPEDRLRLFADLTRARLAPPEGAPPIPPNQRWLDRIRLRILNGILRLYQLVTPSAGFAAVLALIAASIVALRRRRLPYFVVVSVGMLGAMAAIILINTLVAITSFNAINAAYFTGAYGLLLFFTFLGWLALAEAIDERTAGAVSRGGG
jgi:hypothetical protein